jgi:MtN3 and saliva related transmembrane protein
MDVTFAIGVAFWFTLGVMLWNWPMMLAPVTFMLTVVIIIKKLRYA